ncbi:helix-turn-helix domain-containing protein [Paracnuella aquatica]|uniref:helix-turn-helix domain-containing protein n=1 Tax=Paracnuella aquatica TaxID=2268757 RepID=UPI0019D4A61B|nr:helix-turn-helix transcriptional regulator [Paracnuella aquatica]
MAVERVLDELSVSHDGVGLGWAECSNSLDESTLYQLEQRLEEIGFFLLHSNKEKLVTQIKSLLIQAMEQNQLNDRFKFKEYLTKDINKDYSLLSKTFSEQEGKSIEHYFILLKLEKAKELLAYGELNLNEIAMQLGYRSVQYLSKQFKQMFGISPTAYKNQTELDRKPIDQL